MTNEDLKPCPNEKCIQPDHIVVIDEVVSPKPPYYVFCNSCGYQGPHGVTPGVAIELHNQLPRVWQPDWSKYPDAVSCYLQMEPAGSLKYVAIYKSEPAPTLEDGYFSNNLLET